MSCSNVAARMVSGRELFDITTEEEKSKDDWTNEISSGLVVTCLVFFDFEEKLLYQAAGTMDFVMKQALGGATKDMGKMLGGEEEKDPDAAKKEEERQEALRQQEEERKAKHARMEAEREKVRQTIRDKYGLKKKEEKEAEEKAAMEQACEGSLTRPKKAIPRGCGDDEEDEESILDTVLKYLPGPLQDMFKK
ncbi:complexin-2 isoform X1 [Xiphophorus maculatus]|uniref:complexin-2 isoform X1 n=2 Tax=Xiphophorus TaxID=8082 RepID=UPI000C6CA693|nr:complexin-2 isoform X1 [Xiphophorus maculatus]